MPPEKRYRVVIGCFTRTPSGPVEFEVGDLIPRDVRKRAKQSGAAIDELPELNIASMLAQEPPVIEEVG